MESINTDMGRRKKRWWRWLLAVLLLVILGGGLAGWWANRWMQAAMEPVNPATTDSVNITISPGASPVQIANQLQERGLIHSSWFFQVYARYTDQDRRLRAGEYVLSPAMSLRQMIQQLVEGRVKTYSFTIPEGYTVREIAILLARQGVAPEAEFYQLAATGQVGVDWVAGLPDVPVRLEGYLFPDTYQITRETSTVAIIRMMLARFETVYTPLKPQIKALGLTDHQAVTLASIVESEARVSAERPVIAAVYLNRLSRGMLLQADPTVQYALPQPKPRLLYADLEVDSPYNTYRNPGLPPGPIAAPGQASLQAVANPSSVDFLYFVAQNDGSHIFSRTLNEHNAARRRVRQ